jgi:WD40 repeat protein
MPTAIVGIPHPHNRLVISAVANAGCVITFRSTPNGRVVKEAPTESHETAMVWSSTIERLICGNSLGELNSWTVKGFREPTSCRPHNGPVLAVEILRLSSLGASIGTDGRLGLFDPHTMTPVRVQMPTAFPFACGAISADHNLSIVAETRRLFAFNASLPPDLQRAVTFVEPDPTMEHKHVVTSITTIGDEALTLDASGLVKVWDLRTMRSCQTLPPPFPGAVLRSSTFNRILRGSPSSSQCFVPSSDAGWGVVEMDTSPNHVVVHADELPIHAVEISVEARLIVTASPRSVKLWNWKTGSLEGQLGPFDETRGPVSSSPMTALVLSGAAGQSLVVGHEDGTISLLPLPLCDSNWNGDEPAATAIPIRLSCPVITLSALASIIVAFGEKGSVAFDVRNPHRSFRMDTVSGMLRSSLRENVVAAISDLGRLVMIEVNEEADLDHDAAIVDDMREYELFSVLAATRCGLAMCFLNSTKTVCVSDGNRSSVIVSLHTGTPRRVGAIHSLRSEPLAVMYEPAGSTLAVVERDGSCATYHLAALLTSIEKHPQKATLVDHQLAPRNVFHILSPPLSFAKCLPQVLVLAGVKLTCCQLYRIDGVCIGNLDMYAENTGATDYSSGSPSQQRWVPIKERLPSRAMGHQFRLDDDLTIKPYDADRTLKARVTTRGLRQRPLPPSLRQSSPTAQGNDDSPERSPDRTTRDAIARELRPASWRTLRTIAERAMTTKSAAKVAPLSSNRQETSFRTQSPIDVSSSKWAIDNEPRRDRHSNLILAHTRMVTAALNPSKEVVAEASKWIGSLSPIGRRSPPRAPAEHTSSLPSQHKPIVSRTRLMPLQPPSPVHAEGIALQVISKQNSMTFV